MDFDFTKVVDLDSLDGVFSEFELLVAKHNQVSDVFIVDLQETNSDGVVAQMFVALHVIKHLLHGVEHDARVLLVAQHRVGLTGTCLAVREHS